MRATATACLTLLLVSAAHGKGMTDAEVCGAAGCHAVAPDDRLMVPGRPAEGPRAGVPFVRFRFVTPRSPGEGPLKMTMLYVPGRELIRDVGGTWMTPRFPGRLRRVTRGVPTLPAADFPKSQLEPVPWSRRAPAGPAAADNAPPWWSALVAVPIVLGVIAVRRRRGHALPA